MTRNEAMQLQPGDLVRADSWGDDPPQVVQVVKTQLFPDDPMVFFKAGGFWRSSQLRKVESAAVLQTGAAHAEPLA